MELPYSLDVYLTLLDSYNRDHLIFVIAGMGICLAAVACAFLSAARHSTIMKRLILSGLAICAMFIGIIHQLNLMTDFNFMAPIYSGFWVLQGFILLWLSISRRGADLFQAPAISRNIGVAIAVYGIVLHPVIVHLVGNSFGLGTPLAGTAPNPTILVIAGILLTMRGIPPLVMLIFPLAWAGVSAMTAYLLSFPVDYAISIGLLMATFSAFYGHFKRSR